MVNRPGRSHGCFNCIRRRVRCDEARPACLKCLQAELTCEGYRGLPVTFDPRVQGINGVAGTLTPTSAPESQPDQGFIMEDPNSVYVPESSSRNAAHSNHNAIAPVIRRLQRGRPPKRPVQPVTTVVAPALPLPPELSLLAFQAPICVTFLVQNFLGHLDTGRKSLLPAWDVDNVSGTARDSVDALALTFFGKAHHQPNIIVQGAGCYGKALRKLRHDLYDKNAMWSPSVLLSSILLARYELVSSTGSEGWIQHAGGVERLFELRGPQRHQSLAERQIFEAARPIIVIKAITDCKRTFLEETSWLTVPWAHDPGQKSSINHLIDIFCMVPGLLEDHKSLNCGRSFVWDVSSPISPSTSPSGATQGPELIALRQRTQACYDKLTTWKESWDRSYPSAVQSVKITYFPRSDLDFPEAIFDYAFNFTNFLRANEYQLYNTVLFFVSSLMLSVPPPPLDHPRPSVEDLLGQRWEAASDICRAVPYDLFEKHGGSGAYLLLFPLLTTLRLFGEGSEEGKWIKQVLGSIAKKWGMEGERKYMMIE